MIYTDTFAKLCLLRAIVIDEIHEEYSIPREIIKILLPAQLDFSFQTNLKPELTKESIKQLILIQIPNAYENIPNVTENIA